MNQRLSVFCTKVDKTHCSITSREVSRGVVGEVTIEKSLLPEISVRQVRQAEGPLDDV